MAALLYGREIGVSPMEALRSIHCLEGKFEPDYLLVQALCMRACPGTQFITLTPYNERHKRYKIKLRSPRLPKELNYEDIEETKIEEFIHIAQKKRNPQDSPWHRYPKNMLRSKCVKLLAEAWFADVLCGSQDGPLVSATKKTLAEEERDAAGLSEKPKVRENVLTPEQNQRRKEQIEKCSEIEKHEKWASEMEAKECRGTLQ
jgi:hypothetical protein